MCVSKFFSVCLLTHSSIFYRLNALVLGGSSGFIEIYAYGMFKIATVNGVRLVPFHIFSS